ncbi:MAG: carboxylesterase family protein, partial [Kofleriaceae bacterium]
GCTDLACMRAKSGDQILHALPHRLGYILPPGTWYGPVVDGVELTAQPLEMLRAKPSTVPLLVGWNRDEGVLHVIRFDTVTLDQVATFVREAFGERAVAALAAYARETPKDQLNHVITDAGFACAARRIARVMKGPVYQYEFTHPLDDERAHHLGATHSVELWFVFGTEDGGVGLSAAERPLSDKIQDAWGRFARAGDPAGPGLAWPRYTATTDELAVLDYTPSVEAHVKQDLCDRWDASVR